MPHSTPRSAQLWDTQPVPQRFGPPPPHSSPLGQPPQSSTLPQPSSFLPQSSLEHCVGTQASAPVSVALSLPLSAPASLSAFPFRSSSEVSEHAPNSVSTAATSAAVAA
jgi:hypothetical protein